MKKILITGANSYIGTSFEKMVKENHFPILIHTIDMMDNNWKKEDFSKYDSIFHVAGIAHADVGPISKEQQSKYYKVNCNLAIETAKKAKKDGVKQFIYMSSIIVYGESTGVGKNRVITKDTKTSPSNFYGDSKLKAELGLQKLSDENFKIVILRPPMIYGKGSKGNYPMLSKFARRLPIFPKINNERSMLHIDNLCTFVKMMIINEEQGVFYPQNEEYVKTYEMVQCIAKAHGKKILMVRCLNLPIRLLGHTPGKIGGLINKAFGNLVYEKQMSLYKESYNIRNFHESIKETEENK